MDINLATLSNAQGYKILGETENDYMGHSISSAGDVNNDGFGDVIIGAYGAGKSYVLFGAVGGFGDIDLSMLNTTEGFKIFGEVSGDRSGISVSSVGDINGDGYDDVIVGAPGVTNGFGKSYVIFGKATEFSDISLSTLSSTQGFRILGENANDFSGFSVSGAGDVNRDGYDDVIIGASGATNHSGKSYVLFGKIGGFTDVNLSTLNMDQGFRILGEGNNRSGWSVSSAGDVNGDGYVDIIIGAPGAGKSYVIFGKARDFSDISLSTLNSTQGFRIIGEISGDLSGSSVSSAGDLNGDGYADVIVGAPNVGDASGKSYVLFGKANGFSDIDLSILNTTEGFRIFGETSGDRSGISVSSVGDINKDGYDDIIIGAPGATSYAGESYVIFGKATEFSDISLSTLSSTQGFKILGENAADRSGISVGGAGDVNGDGYMDIIIGADQYLAGSGKSYIIFAMLPLEVTTDNVTSTYGTIPVFNESYSGFVNFEDPFDLTIQPIASTSATTTSSPGDYQITVSEGVSSHYYFIYASSTLTINKAPLQVTANNMGIIYGGIVPVLTESYNGFVNFEGPSDLILQPTVITSATNTSKVGSYPITVLGGVSDNYDFSYYNGYLTIYKAPLTVKANNVSMLINASVMPTLTLTYDGFVNLETPFSLITQPIVATTATINSSLGIYPITVSGGVSNDYDFNYVDGYLTIYEDSGDSSRSSSMSSFIKIGIPILGGIAVLVSIMCILRKCKHDGIWCFEKTTVAPIVLSMQQSDAASIEQTSEDNTIYYDQTNDGFNNNEILQPLDY